ncbi:unnamed protein product [Clonostachys rhizophaga]|uniref:HMG box domain-containing protein n=1 Tax=Clonostachys rhizophaga TaxID=160324 RepID=A0A9N9VAC5_9HYPO|nr:unnamed protein product [Clonostachys rhizophaga]
MSQVATATVQEETVMVRSPLYTTIDGHDEGSSARSTAPTTPEHQSSAAAVESVGRAQRSSEESHAKQKAGNLKINTDAGLEEDASPENAICVCTPAQKVPRPPNSFMLYRAQMQAQISAESRGLSNPQISRILGDRWANEPEEEKAKWRSLAQEENRRHRLQYPGYKYQPRRRGSKAVNSVGEDESGRCSRCNGRFPSRTPQTPALPGTPGRDRADLSSHATQQPSPSSDDSQHPRSGGSLSGGSASMSLKRLGDHHLGSPETKRPRLGVSTASRVMPSPEGSAYGPMPHGHCAHSAVGEPYNPNRHHVNSPYPHYGGAYGRHHGGPMPPPPRPPIGSAWAAMPHYHGARDSIADESLRLPPLQTAIPPSISPARDYDMRYGPTPVTAGGYLPSASSRDSPGKNTVEHILSIPYDKKLAVLGKICPRLPRQEGGTPGPDSRGPIIVVEGLEDDLLSYVGKIVEEALLVSPEEIALKTWVNEVPSDVPPIPREGERGEDAKSPVELQDLLPSIFGAILKWHENSKEMVKHIQSSSHPDQKVEEVEEEKSHKKDQESSDGNSGPPAPLKISSATPVALVRGGFSLTTSERFACSTSQSLSNYNARDHWQWMATLWRGVPGPDLVIYIRSSSESDAGDSRNIDYLKQLGVIVVTISKDRRLGEGDERRLAFEVIEWMRSGWIRDSKPRIR